MAGPCTNSMLLTYENENGTTRFLESNSGLLMYSLPSLNKIIVGKVREVTDETTPYFSAILGDLAMSILPNLRFLVAYL